MSPSPRPHLHKDWIDPEAFEIVERLQRAGFRAYLVGGCVRDLLLGKEPKDYDVATDARPQQVKRIVPNAYIIGKRFRLVLAKRGDQTFEIATFRRDPTPEEAAQPDLEGDNLFGTPEEDGRRRDFTINALFYDPLNETLLDFCEGQNDLELGLVRMIGEPKKRLTEDPIRILRAIRLTHMIRFKMEPGLRRGISELAEKLRETALPRRREEYLKFLRLDDPSMAFLACEDLGVLKNALPTLTKILNETEDWRHFYAELRGFHNFRRESPTELFAGLMLAVCKLKLKLDLEKDDLLAFDPSEDPDLQTLMRDELGMFKLEQANFVKALRLIPLLKRRHEFEKRGPKRKSAIVRNEAFPLALRLAEHEVLLSVEDLHYWRFEYENRQDRNEDDLHRPPRRRRRRRRRSPPTPGN